MAGVRAEVQGAYAGGQRMSREERQRQPHAVLDLPSRRQKGLKIERLLGLQPGATLRMLEVGTGSGGIAHYFGTHPRLDCAVDSVDVVDSRLETEGYRYHQVEDVTLPFADDTFDIILSNHVIEHVGEHAAQLAHLAELKRVMKPDGRGYLAVPNRWMLVEPHYRLAFLSWLPERLRSPYLRLWGRGDFYDCRPYTAAALEHDFRTAGFLCRNISIPALHAALDIEGGHKLARALADHMPQGFLHGLRNWSPTLIYLFWHPNTDISVGTCQR